jgi:hypothetical protein
MQAKQPHEDWTISTEVVAYGGGSSVVEVTLTNARIGQLPTFKMEVDLHPGMETTDVRLLALNILASGANALAAEAVAEGARLVQDHR